MKCEQPIHGRLLTSQRPPPRNLRTSRSVFRQRSTWRNHLSPPVHATRGSGLHPPGSVPPTSTTSRVTDSLFPLRSPSILRHVNNRAVGRSQCVQGRRPGIAGRGSRAPGARGRGRRRQVGGGRRVRPDAVAAVGGGRHRRGHGWTSPPVRPRNARLGRGRRAGGSGGLPADVDALAAARGRPGRAAGVVAVALASTGRP